MRGDDRSSAASATHSPHLIAERKHRDLAWPSWWCFFELGIISWVRHRFMDTPIASAVLQIALGGALVFLAGVLIGNS